MNYVLEFKRNDEFIQRNRRKFYSVRCLAREFAKVPPAFHGVEAGTIRRLLNQQATEPIPFYQDAANPKSTELYVEWHNVENLFAAAIIAEQKYERRSATPARDPEQKKKNELWSNEWRLQVLKREGRWSVEELAIQTPQKRDKYGNVVNFPLPLPLEEIDEGPFIVEVETVPAVAPVVVVAPATTGVLARLFQDPDLEQFAEEILTCIVRYCKALRPCGNESTSDIRNRLLAKQSGRCKTCGVKIAEPSGDTVHVDHAVSVAECVAELMAEETSIIRACSDGWSDNNIRAVHKKCNQTTSKLALSNRAKKHKHEKVLA